MKKYIFSLLAIILFFFSSCLKSEDPITRPDPLIQLAKDTLIIRKFLTDDSIPAVKYGESGIYYQIKDQGTGDTISQSSLTIKYKYELRLLNGTVISKSDNLGVNANFSYLITGLQAGIPLIKEGGKIRLIMASGYAYGIDGYFPDNIPPNAILDYDIELLDVK